MVVFSMSKIKLNQKRVQQLSDSRNVALYIFSIVVLAITWSGVKTLQNNYDLQKKISTLKQQNTVLALQNDTTALQNKYYQTDEYIDLAARQNLGLAAPGEKELLIPKSVAMKYIDQTLVPASKASTDNRPTFIKNLEAWRDFLLGRKAVSD